MSRKFAIMRSGYHTKQFFWRCVAAAAFSNARHSSGYAYFASTTRFFNTNVNQIHCKTGTPPTRLYSSSGNNDESFVGKMKSYLPFLNENKKRRQSELVKRKASEDISTGIESMLKDAPIAVRLMGKIVSPLIGKVAGTMAEAMEEQSRQLDDCLDDARNLIVKDMSAVRELGEPVTVGRPFNQSSSSMSVNGQTQSSLQAQFEVQGSVGSGTATMNARDGKISSLNLSVNGKNYSIDVNGGSTGSRTWSPPGLGKNRNYDSNDIIDVEFTDKMKK